MSDSIKKKLAPVLIIIVALAIAVGLKFSAGGAKKEAAEETAYFVEVAEATVENRNAIIEATGTVEAARQINVIPQVGGKLISISTSLMPGGRINKGDELARIDPADYQLAITQDQARVRAAELELELESGRKEIARAEWGLLGEKRDGKGSELALRKPQLEVVRANLEAAKSGLQRSRLNLSRSIITAPFNAIVVDKRADLGQVVGPTTPIASLLGSDNLWVEASVSLEKLPLIDIPGINAEVGSPVKVVQKLSADKTIVREGEVLQLQGVLDPQTRTAKLLINIPHPFKVGPDEIPLMPGAFVELEITGKLLKDVFVLPRESLREGRFAWVVGPENQLEKHPIEVIWKEEKTIFVKSGISPGDPIVISPLSSALSGAKVSILDPSKNRIENPQAEQHRD